MCRRLFILLFIFTSLTLTAQKQQLNVSLLDSMHLEKDFNKKKFNLNAISDEIKELWSSNSLNEIQALSSQIVTAKSINGNIEVVAFSGITYANTLQIEWLVKENSTDKGAVWQFEEEIRIKPSKTKTNLFINLDYDANNDLFKLKIGNNAGLTYVSCEDLLTKCWFEKLFEQKTDAEKDSVNEVLKVRLNKLWKNPVVFESELTGLKRMKTILSKDKKVKIATYNIQKDGFKHEFYGAVITKEQGIVLVHTLNDASNDIRSPERATLNEKKWYGAIYIDMIETKVKDKIYYTLIGYKGYDEFVKTRLLDVLIIQNNRLRFGAPIFKEDRLTRNRVIYQYSAGATMMMRYDSDMKMIVMDNLEPTESFYRGVYRFYGPDFSYNGFKFQKGKWELQEDIDLRNPKAHN
nr:hypothetical protein [uncultured Carboxylicivirga sp.]